MEGLLSVFSFFVFFEVTIAFFEDQGAAKEERVRRDFFSSAALFPSLLCWNSMEELWLDKREARRGGGGISLWQGKHWRGRRRLRHTRTHRRKRKRGGWRTQQPRVRQFCVDIAHSFIWRNIAAELLREHCVRQICAHYKGMQIFANSTHASTYASNLRKKIKRNLHAKKIKKKKSGSGFEPGISNLKSVTLTTQPPSFSYIPKPRFMPYIHKVRDFGAISAHASTHARKLRKTLTIFLQT